MAFLKQPMNEGLKDCEKIVIRDGEEAVITMYEKCTFFNMNYFIKKGDDNWFS